MNGSFSQAENRVRQMNNITRGYLERSNSPAEKVSAVVSVPRFEPVQDVESKSAPCPELHRPNPRVNNCSKDPLDRLFKGADGERTLILLLILVLLNEKADIKLIIALMYLIL